MKTKLESIIKDVSINLKISLSFALCIEIVSNLQIVYMVLKSIFTDNQHQFKQDLPSLFTERLSLFIGAHFFPDPTHPNELLVYWTWICFACYLSLHTILLFPIFIFHHEALQVKMSRLMRIFSLSYLLHSRVLFFFIQYFFMGIISSKSACGLGTYKSLCHDGYFATSIIFCIVNLGLSLAKEFLFYSITKNKKNAYAIKDNLFHKSILLYKTIAVIIYFQLQQNSLANVINPLTNIFFSIIALGILIVKLPFYNTTLLKTSLLTIGFVFSLSLISVIGMTNIDRRVLSAIFFSLTPLILKSLLIFFNRLSERIMQGELFTPARAIYFAIMLEEHDFGYSPPLFYNKTRNNIEKMISSGAIVQKSTNNNNILVENYKNKKEYEEKMYRLIIDILNSILKRHPKSQVLLLFMAQIYFKKLGNIPKATHLIKTIEADNPSIPIKNSIACFNSRALQLYRRNHGTGGDNSILNVVQYFKERDLSTSIKKIMAEEIDKRIEFWKEIRREQIDIKEIIELSQAIQSNSDYILNQIQSHTDKSKKYLLNPLVLYGTYLELIVEYRNEAKLFLKQFWNSSNNSHIDSRMYDIYSDKAVAILVSIENTDFGQILDISGSGRTLFKADKDSLIGKNVDSLFPSIFGDEMLRRLHEYAKSSNIKLGSSWKTYGKSSYGDFFEVEIQLSFYSEANQHIGVMILLKRLSSSQSILIVDKNGIVLDYSEDIKSTIFNGNQGKKEAFSDFSRIVPEFSKINMAFNMVYGYETTKNQLYSNTTLFSTSRQLFESGEPLRQDKGEEIKYLVLMKKDSIESLEFEQAKQICDRFTAGNKLLFLNEDFTCGSEHQVQISPLVISNQVCKIITIAINKEKKNTSSPLSPRKRASVETKIPLSDLLGNSSEAIYHKTEIDKEKLMIPSPIFKMETKSIPQSNVFKAKEIGIQNAKNINKSDKENVFRLEIPTKQILFKNKDSHEQQAENSVSSAFSRINSVKFLKANFGRPDAFPLARRTKLALFSITIFLIIIGSWSFILTQSATDQVKTGIEIINLASLRLSQAMRGWQTATRFFLRKVKLRNGSPQAIQQAIYSNGAEMLQYNKEIIRKFSSSAINEKYVRDIRNHGVRLWDLYGDKTVNGGEMDTFLSTDLLGHKMMFIGNTTGDVNSPILMDPVQFIVNNTGNDYLIFSEELIVNTQHMLEDVIMSNISKLQLVMGLQIAALMGVCLCLMYASRKVVRSYRILFETLVRIDNKHIAYRLTQLRKMKLLLLEDLDTFKFKQLALKTFGNDDKETVKEHELAGQDYVKKTNHKIIMKGMLKDLILRICFSLFIIQSVTIFFNISLLDSIWNFRSLEDVNTQLAVTTRAGYKTSSVISTFYVEILWRNDTSMLVRNVLPRYQLIKDLQAISNINDDLISVFSKNTEGIVDPLIKEMLEGTVCKFLSSAVQDYCNTATENYHIGLLSINSKLLMTAEFYTHKYLENPTYDNAKSFIDAYVAIMRPCADTLDEAYQFLNIHILEVLNTDLKSFEMKAILLHLGILFSIILSVLVVKQVSIERIKAIDICRGKILKVIPLKIFLEDKAINHYLNRHINIQGAFNVSL